MKVCSACNHRFEAQTWHCPQCGTGKPLESGFVLLAPGLAHGAQTFNPAFYAELAKLEARNFWFRARNELVVRMFRKHFQQATNFLEVGCGTGFVLSGMAGAFPDVKLFGSELFAAGLPFAKQRAPNATLYQMDARAIPFEREFDVIGAFDVIEHIEEDELVLGQIRNALRDGGGMMVTVPQHRFLWSQHDEHACHVRRYSASELRAKVEKAGFEIVRSTSFVSLLLPAMALSRLRRLPADSSYDPMAELRIGDTLNAALKTVLDVEVALISAGLSFPAGGSLMMIAIKR